MNRILSCTLLLLSFFATAKTSMAQTNESEEKVIRNEYHGKPTKVRFVICKEDDSSEILYTQDQMLTPDSTGNFSYVFGKEFIDQAILNEIKNKSEKFIIKFETTPLDEPLEKKIYVEKIVKEEVIVRDTIVRQVTKRVLTKEEQKAFDVELKESLKKSKKTGIIPLWAKGANNEDLRLDKSKQLYAFIEEKTFRLDDDRTSQSEIALHAEQNIEQKEELATKNAGSSAKKEEIQKPVAESPKTKETAKAPETTKAVETAKTKEPTKQSEVAKTSAPQVINRKEQPILSAERYYIAPLAMQAGLKVKPKKGQFDPKIVRIMDFDLLRTDMKATKGKAKKKFEKALKYCTKVEAEYEKARYKIQHKEFKLAKAVLNQGANFASGGTTSQINSNLKSTEKTKEKTNKINQGYGIVSTNEGSGTKKITNGIVNGIGNAIKRKKLRKLKQEFQIKLNASCIKSYEKITGKKFKLQPPIVEEEEDDQED